MRSKSIDMMYIFKRLYSFFLKCIPERQQDAYIKFTISKLKGKDPLTYAYNINGILKYENEHISGEKFVLEKVLRKNFSKKKVLTFFDVGANIGNYSMMVHELYPYARIFAFEPNPHTFSSLQRRINEIQNIKIFNFGLGETKSNNLLYTYKDDLTSEHASIFADHKDVICEELAKRDVTCIPIKIRTLDDFCEENSIFNIDFLKIDTEGFEHSVLSGAKQLINENRIGFIQFEFNVANILSRTFLKDFYNILSDKYEFYRLDSSQLIWLGNYNSLNEIFKYQNILAINKDHTDEKFYH